MPGAAKAVRTSYPNPGLSFGAGHMWVIVCDNGRVEVSVFEIYTADLGLCRPGGIPVWLVVAGPGHGHADHRPERLQIRGWCKLGLT